MLKKEPKGFIIECRECGFHGEDHKFTYSAWNAECEMCGSHSSIKIECLKCGKNKKEVQSW